MAIRVLSGPQKWQMLRYTVGYEDEGPALQAELGEDFAATANAYDEGGPLYDFREHAVAKMGDMEIMRFVHRYPTPQVWARKHFYPTRGLPDNWADYFKSLGGPIPTV